MSSILMSPINAGIAVRLGDKKFRAKFIRAWARDEIAMEIRALRKKRGLLQSQLAAMAGTGQSAVSRTEKAEYEGWTFKSLVKIAQALDARLRITFEPIEDVVSKYQRQEDQDLWPIVASGTFEAAATIEIEAQSSDMTCWLDRVEANIPSTLDVAETAGSAWLSSVETTTDRVN